MLEESDDGGDLCWQIVTLERSFENDDEEMYEEIARGNKEIKGCK